MLDVVRRVYILLDMRTTRGVKLSDVQRAALQSIIAEFDVANAAELARWGKPLAAGISLPDGITRPTMWALERAGLIVVKSTRVEASSLRRGAYGRWIGGSRTATDTAHTVRATDAGRAFILGGAE